MKGLKTTRVIHIIRTITNRVRGRGRGGGWQRVISPVWHHSTLVNMHIGLLALQHTNTALCTTCVTPHSTRYEPHAAGLPCNTATNAVTQYTLSATRTQDSLQHTTYTVSGHCMCVTQYTLHVTRTQDSLQHTTNTTCVLYSTHTTHRRGTGLPVSYSTHYTPQGHRTPCNTLPTLHVVHITHYMPEDTGLSATHYQHCM